MFIGVLRLELYLHATSSLKDKRLIIKSLKTRLRNRFNVSVTEVDHLDKWQRSSIGIALVTNDRRFIDSVFSKVLNFVLRDSRIEIIDEVIDVL